MSNRFAGLLDPAQSLAPFLGAGNPNDPILQALARIAALRAQAQQTTAPPPELSSLPPPQAPVLTPNIAVPFVPGGSPSGVSLQEAESQVPVQPPRPAPASFPSSELGTPMQQALFAAGEAIQPDAPSLVHAVAQALGAGVPAFRQAKARQKAEQAHAEAMAEVLAREDVPDTLKNLIRALETVEVGRGLRLLEDLEREQGKAHVLGEGQRLVRGGRVEVEAEKEPQYISHEGRLFRKDPDGSLSEIVAARAIGGSDTFVDAAWLAGIDPESNPLTWTEEQREQVYNNIVRLRQAGRAEGTSVAITLPGKENFFSQLGSAAAQQLFDDYRRVQESDMALQSLERVKTLADQARLGQLGPELSFLVRFAESMGIPTPQSIKTAAEATQLIQAHLYNIVIPRLKEMGAKPTDRDMIALEKSIGSTRYTPAVLKEIVTLQENIIKRRQNEYNRAFLNVWRTAQAEGGFVPPNLAPVGVQMDAQGRRAFKVDDTWYLIP